MQLDGKRVLITGAAGGLGSAISRAMHARGAQVAVLDRGSDGLTKLAHELDTTAFEADVTSESEVQTAFERSGARLGGLDGIVVCAGIQLHGLDGPVDTVPLDVWQRTLDVNLTGAFLCTKHAMPMLVKQPTSSIVLVGSPTGLTMSGAGYSAYGASKAGMMALGRIIAADYAIQGVRANVIVPGTMDTPLIAPLLKEPTTRRALLAGIPAGRIGQPDDLAGITAWLLSDESRFATGAFFAIDGGLTAR